MEERTYSKGLLFWIDDSLAEEDIPLDPWSELFSNYSDRVYRLMDLSLIVATNYEDAMEWIDKLDQNEMVGTYIYCVVDLSIPRQKSEAGTIHAKAKYGISVAKELHKRGISFAFLSSSTGGTSKIDESGLGAIPYYVKEEGNLWRFPAPLMLKVLSEFHRHIKWITLDWVEKVIHPQTSTFSETNFSATKYYPFFSYYRDYVERCEYRDFSDIDRPIMIRSDPKHSDEFVLQSLMVYYYPYFIRHPKTATFIYGHAHSRDFNKALASDSISDFDTTIPIIRVHPAHTTVEELRILVENEKNRRIAIILPDDETIDPYIETLREYNISAVEELPKIREGDVFLQEELIKRSSILLFQEWYKQFDLGDSVLLHKGSLSYPQLLINPINWAVLLETKNVPIELSDPYEILFELLVVLEEMDDEQALAIRNLLNFGTPITYRNLLRVGQKTLSSEEHNQSYLEWIESALDFWLKTSSQFPHGIFDFSLRSKFIHDEHKKNQILAQMDAWQDSCYDILVDLFNEYRAFKGFEKNKTINSKRLYRAEQFVRVIGEKRLLSGDIDYINWEELEQIRWPHRQYSLPSAVFRRIREAGKYLWIQPEGLDLAQTFPSGRRKYRILGAMVDKYWHTLNWLGEINSDLPLGWKENIKYLTDILREHNVLSAWENEQDKLWQSLLCLLNNGGPVLYITNLLLANKSISSGKKYLSKVQGYGTVLGYLRGYQQKRIGQWITPSISGLALEDDLGKIKVAHSFFSKYYNIPDLDAEKNIGELKDDMDKLIFLLGKLAFEDLRKLEEKDIQKITDQMLSFLSDKKLNFQNNSGWYMEDLATMLPSQIDSGISPSLLGTKVDYLWLLLDTMSALNNITRQIRYYDGYHFLSVLGDLRNRYVKDVQRPDIPLPMVEMVLELFIASIEGIIAQMAWLVELSGHPEIAKKIMPNSIKIHPPANFVPPSQNELSGIVQAQLNEQNWELFSLGIIGKEFASSLTYHDGVSKNKQKV